MGKKKRVYLVRCSRCKKAIGADSKIREVEKCFACHRGKEKVPPKTAASNFARVKKGPAKDLPKKYREYHFRSAWERNFARVLCKKKIEWTYEERVFQFYGVSRRPFQYVPDFYEVKADIYWEVKGYLRSQDRSKMRRLKAQYPEAFKKMRALLSKNNKAAIAFYSRVGIPMSFIEDLREEWSDKIKAWE